LKNNDASAVAKTVSELYMNYPKEVSDLLFNIVGSHDTERILTVLDDIELVKNALFLIFTMPGIPCLYYGDEAGMSGGRDPFNRGYFPWGKEHRGILEFVKKLSKLRRSQVCFESGNIRFLKSEGPILVYARHKVICAVNSGELPDIIRTDMEYINAFNGSVGTVHPIERKGRLLLFPK